MGKIASATNKQKEEEEDSTETEGDESDSVIPDFKEATKVVKNNDSNEINTGEKLKSDVVAVGDDEINTGEKLNSDVVAVCGDDNKVLSSISLKLKSEPKPSSSSTPSLLDSSFTSLARSSSLVPVTATPVTTQSTTSTSTTP